MTAGQRPALGLIVAGAFSLLVPALIALSSASCTALWAHAGTWVALGTLTAAGLALVWAGMDGRPFARVLAALPAGIVAGLQLQPSTAAVVALLVTGLTLGAAPRTRFAETVAMFVGAGALGYLVLAPTFASRVSC